MMPTITQRRMPAETPETMPMIMLILSLLFSYPGNKAMIFLENKFTCKIKILVFNTFYNILTPGSPLPKSHTPPHQKKKKIYTTKGRDRFHWAATPLKPHKVKKICYMTYRYSVLYFLNLSLKHFSPTENGKFCENIQIRRPLSFPVLTCRACLIDVLPIEDRKHCTL